MKASGMVQVLAAAGGRSSTLETEKIENRQSADCAAMAKVGDCWPMGPSAPDLAGGGKQPRVKGGHHDIQVIRPPGFAARRYARHPRRLAGLRAADTRARSGACRDARRTAAARLAADRPAGKRRRHEAGARRAATSAGNR